MSIAGGGSSNGSKKGFFVGLLGSMVVEEEEEGLDSVVGEGGSGALGLEAREGEYRSWNWEYHC